MTQYYWRSGKHNDIGGHGNYIQDILGANVRESNRLYDLSIDGRIFKCILREQTGRVWTGCRIAG